MKKFSSVFLLFCSCMMSFSAFSLSKRELVGTWLWSSIGCRDTDLSASSHQPITDNNQNPDLISEATFVFSNDGSTSMDFVQAGESISEIGTYEISGDGEVVYMIPQEVQEAAEATNKEVPDEAKFKLNVVNNNTRLAVVRCLSDYEREKQIPDVDQGEIDKSIRALRNTCGENRCFVYLIGKV